MMLSVLNFVGIPAENIRRHRVAFRDEDEMLEFKMFSS